MPFSFTKPKKASHIQQEDHSLAVPDDSVLEESKQNDLSNLEATLINTSEPSMSKEMINMLQNHYNEFKYKTLADVVEALIGAYYEQSGLQASQKFLQAIGVLKLPNYVFTIVPPPNNKQQLEAENVRKVHQFLKEKLNYSFKNDNLMLQALSHSTTKSKYNQLS